MTHAEFIAALDAKFVGQYTFELEPGRKYTRVVATPVSGSGRSSYCFLDADGNVYKSAGWKGPAKGIRANLKTLNMDKVDAYGSWLYR